MPSPSTAPVPDDVARDAQRALEQRRAVLGPCLAEMGFTEHGGPPPDLPGELEFDGLRVPLEPWERSFLLGRGTGETEVILAHLAEGIAFRAKCQSRLLCLEHAPPPQQEMDSFLFELIDDAAAGLALQAEVQRDIDRLVSKGQLADAKKLTGFRRKIDRGLADLKRRIGPEANEQAQARSAEMLTPRNWTPAPRKRALPRVEHLDLPPLTPITPAAEPASGSELPEPTTEELFEQGLIEQNRLEQGAAPARSPEAGPIARGRTSPDRRIGRLIVTLAVCVLLYGAFRLARRPTNIPPRLERDRFAHIEAVLRVRPRPPSMFIKLDSGSWRDLAPAARLELLEELGRIAGDEGYFGVHVKTSDGKAVGRWLRKTGAEMVTPVPGS